MAKAFDTVGHDFVNYVYKFFGLGPWLIQALNTISTNRTAAILLEGGSTLEEIVLGSGFPQGNPPSPNQFNICQQIFIFKLEFDGRIKNIFDGIQGAGPEPVPIPVPIPVPNELLRRALPVNVVNPIVYRVYGALENGGQSGKFEAFADDTTPMGKLDRTGILAIKEIVSEFATATAD
jgi:hypothetical protein